MMNTNIDTKTAELSALSDAVRELIRQKKFSESEEQITRAMGKFPHAPHPHNLMGILLENEGDHPAAMKHFRASWDLDPTYLPARYNLNQFADILCGERRYAYDEADSLQDHKGELYTKYSDSGIGHFVKRNSHI